MEILEMLPNVGFPIVLSLFLIVRIEKKMDELTKSITELTYVLKKE